LLDTWREGEGEGLLKLYRNPFKEQILEYFIQENDPSNLKISKAQSAFFGMAMQHIMQHIMQHYGFRTSKRVEEFGRSNVISNVV